MAAAWDGPEGDHWSDHADRYTRSSERFRHALIGALDLRPSSRVLDIGCGTGVSTIEAGRIASEGTALGIDLSQRMLGLAREAAAAERLEHVRFQQADAQDHPFTAGEYDVAISCFGAMFFADPVAAFANIRRALRPGGRICLLAWRDLERNEWVDAVRNALAAGRRLPTPPAGAPGPFSLADRDIATERLAAAGYRAIEFNSVGEPITFGTSADDAYPFMSTLGITRGLTADLDDASRAAALEQLYKTLVDHETADGVVFNASAWLITANNHEEPH